MNLSLVVIALVFFGGLGLYILILVILAAIHEIREYKKRDD